MTDITTTDLFQFGYRERRLAEELLKERREQGLPEDFYDDEVTIMMNGDKLESFYTDFETGEEDLSEEAKQRLFSE